jgi:2-keto-myo-inositol isomerase
VALRELRPMLEDHGLIGLVEPLGFETCALRHKAEAADAIEALGAAGTFRSCTTRSTTTSPGTGPIFPN